MKDTTAFRYHITMVDMGLNCLSADIDDMDIGTEDKVALQEVINVVQGHLVNSVDALNEYLFDIATRLRN